MPRLVPVAAPDAGCTWSPEAVYDESTQDHPVFWASRNGSDHFAKFRIWACRTKDFQSFGEPFVYIDKERGVIDTDIVRAGGKYYRVPQDEKLSATTMETSAQLVGPWLDVSQFSLATLRGYEGPAFFWEPAAVGKTPTWCLLLDRYSKGTGYQPFIGHDLASGQFMPVSDFHYSFQFRHGAVLPITSRERAALQSADLTSR